MVTQVIMGHAGMGIDFGHKGVELCLGHLCGAKGRAEAEFCGLEIGPDAPDYLVRLHAAHAVQGFFFGNAELLAKGCIRPGNERKPCLDDVQKAFIHKVKLRLFHDMTRWGVAHNAPRPFRRGGRGRRE